MPVFPGRQPLLNLIMTNNALSGVEGAGFEPAYPAHGRSAYRTVRELSLQSDYQLRIPFPPSLRLPPITSSQTGR